jgi:Flp pilus assembly protein TadG
MTRVRLREDRRGAVAVEFALVVPLFLMLIMGLCDLSYQAYVQSVLIGAVNKAGRDGTIQGATAASIDSAVLAQVQAAAPRAAFTTGYPLRKSYAKFGDIQPEPFVDLNGNSLHDNGECFTDINDNGLWDTDPGSNGQGGAGDAVAYTVSIVYPRLFPLQAWLGWGSNQTLSATTTLKNQPYALQQTISYDTVCS